MPTAKHPPVLVFDVNETLLDLAPLEALFARWFGDAAAMREWFAQLVLYSQTLTLANRYAEFGTIAGAVLHMVAETRRAPLPDGAAATLGNAVLSLPPHPDVVPAIARLHAAGFRTVTLTNNAPGAQESQLRHAGIAHLFEHRFSVDRVRRFKPAPECYAQVADALGVERSQLLLVACHIWDTIGAQAAGCKGSFIARAGNAELPLPGLPAPDYHCASLTELADILTSP